MAISALLQVQRAPVTPPGHDIDALGPSNSSDSGSDVQGGLAASPLDELEPLEPADEATSRRASDTDGDGTGERRSVLGEEEGEEAADISPDRVLTLSEMESDDADGSSS
jgi:hypothetical protein